MTQVQFVGIEPWSPDDSRLVVDCETSEGSLDLHNYYNLSDVVLRLGNGSMYLVLERVDLASTPDHYPSSLVLGFLEIRELSVKQAEDFDVRSAIDFEYVIHYLLEGEPMFTIMAGDSLFSFSSKRVILRRFGGRTEAIEAVAAVDAGLK